MTDISAFIRFLEQPDAPSPGYVPTRWTWLVGYKTTSGRFAYQIGDKGPLSKLRTYSLADARAAAESFGLPVKEYGPPEAFGRPRDTYQPAHRPTAATIDAFFYLFKTAKSDNAARLTAWLRDHQEDAPALLKLLERRT